jgi:hypothetical protein
MLNVLSDADPTLFSGTAGRWTLAGTRCARRARASCAAASTPSTASAARASPAPTATGVMAAPSPPSAATRTDCACYEAASSSERTSPPSQTHTGSPSMGGAEEDGRAKDLPEELVREATLSGLPPVLPRLKQARHQYSAMSPSSLLSIRVLLLQHLCILMFIVAHKLSSYCIMTRIQKTASSLTSARA